MIPLSYKNDICTIDRLHRHPEVNHVTNAMVFSYTENAMLPIAHSLGYLETFCGKDDLYPEGWESEIWKAHLPEIKETPFRCQVHGEREI